MMITAIIFALSILLFVCYTMVMNRVLRNRFETSNNDANQPLNEELILDMAEHKLNVQKLGLMTVAIGVCFALSFFIR